MIVTAKEARSASAPPVAGASGEEPPLFVGGGWVSLTRCLRLKGIRRVGKSYKEVLKGFRCTGIPG